MFLLVTNLAITYILTSLSSCDFQMLFLHLFIAYNSGKNVLDIYSSGECPTLKVSFHFNHFLISHILLHKI